MNGGPFSSGGNSAVECQLPKLDVAGSIPVPRSILFDHLQTLFKRPAGKPFPSHHSQGRRINALIWTYRSLVAIPIVGVILSAAKDLDFVQWEIVGRLRLLRITASARRTPAELGH